MAHANTAMLMKRLMLMEENVLYHLVVISLKDFFLMHHLNCAQNTLMLLQIVDSVLQIHVH